ncbi:hypothetical protein PAAG_11505 [Paracoccidioides lutzii Pb01]|uniref:Uncharacterized protein n=1 Tax=Paracoccidioides lutzii (strain ATCC MYA-826 / Pb01) TaxID=502779 RepID=A0A0A2V621_PARBA|nr:hypothetical protein PAAG_11505 [Paracoccidioides lutzii Pb01]KGQ01782.1 hypothetical protein PAAG_11505 [Paracoccidioides lutzii Pb01]
MENGCCKEDECKNVQPNENLEDDSIEGKWASIKMLEYIRLSNSRLVAWIFALWSSAPHPRSEADERHHKGFSLNGPPNDRALFKMRKAPHPPGSHGHDISTANNPEISNGNFDYTPDSAPKKPVAIRLTIKVQIVPLSESTAMPLSCFKPVNRRIFNLGSLFVTQIGRCVISCVIFA